MSFVLNTKDYMTYIKKAAETIDQCGDYISLLDAATGDGDHWINLNKGFQAIVAKSERLKTLDISDCLKEIGVIFMNVVGGSSGALYGGAYLAAAKVVYGFQEISKEQLGKILKAMAEDMIRRGNSEPGYKTMIDAIYPAAEAYKDAIENGYSDFEVMQRVKKAAIEGADATKDMPALRGRASYQKDKGVGHLDPGAVTMSYQIMDLCDYILDNKIDRQHI